MKETAPNVVYIPPKPELQGEANNRRRQLRAAAYCRVSTDSEEQLSSYKNQMTYYTDLIMKNPEWTMAGIFADEGITGTSAKKRPEFLRMIHQCKQKKIDIILVKSISRFARNTVDCLNYVRLLKGLGIAVIFEEQNINSLQEDSEFLITLHGAFAQQESESTSSRVRWGKEQAAREGKVPMCYKKLYAYRKGTDGQPEIIPEEAEIVRFIYRQFLAGDSLRMIKKKLEERCVVTVSGKLTWSSQMINNILTNEKYCGDALLQKTFIADCISKKVVKNTGQRPMYLVQNHHEGIVDRKTFDAVQTEMARRCALTSAAKKAAPTGHGCYSGKYALTERLVCGKCGTMYRRCTWIRNGTKRIVWRCISRLEYGTKYCPDSPTIEEPALQKAILTTLNTTMSGKEILIQTITDAMMQELVPIHGEQMSLSAINARLAELESEFGQLLPLASECGSDAYKERFQEILTEMTALKEKRVWLENQLKSSKKANQKIDAARQIMERSSADLTEWDETTIRQLVETVKVLSADEIEVHIKGGVRIRQKNV